MRLACASLCNRTVLFTLGRRWFSGTALKNGTAWRAASKLTLSACYPTGANAVAVSVRSSKNLSNPAAGPFTCVRRVCSLEVVWVGTTELGIGLPD